MFFAAGITIDDFLYLALHVLLYLTYWVYAYLQFGKTKLRNLRLVFATNYKNFVSVQIWRFRQLYNVAMDFFRLRRFKVHKSRTKVTGNFVANPQSYYQKKDNWDYFILVWTILVLLFVELNASNETVQHLDWSQLIIMVDIAVITWLCFYSGDFRLMVMKIVKHRNDTPEFDNKIK